MRKARRSAVAVAVAAAAAVAVLRAGYAHAQPEPARGCPDAKRAWLSGELARAESLARACLKVTPGDSRVWFELSRALAASGKYSEALAWTRRAIAAYPGDMDWQALHIRILVWSGELDAAWKHVPSLTPAAFDDPDTARLVADLTFWRKRHADATKRYSALLERFGADADVHRNRGLAYLELDRPDRALADARRACKLEPRHCAAYTDLRNQLSAYTIRAETRITDTNTSPGWGNLVLGVDRKFLSGLGLGVQVDAQDRFGEDGESSAVITASGSMKLPRRWVATSAVAVGVLGAPLRYSGQIEGGRAFSVGLETYLKLWYLDFTTGPVAIVSPAVFFTRPTYELRARYFLSNKAQPGTTHAVAAEAHYTGIDRYRFRLDAVGGQSADVDDVLGLGLVEQFWRVGVGASRTFGWRHTVSLGYAVRTGTVEVGGFNAGTRKFRRHIALLKYAAKL